MRRVFLAVSAVAVAACFIACGGAGDTPRTGGTENGARPVASAEEQAKRKSAIDKLTREGVFKEVIYGELAVIRVGPKFMALDFRDKQTFVGIVAAYHYRIPSNDKVSSSEVVRVLDSKTDKLVARYDHDGLTME